ncbi:hypothetical protein [Corallococcus silvisoli]|uniref:hypothetical protein n=1 Tax=Corallococcus silvisoli TaxID=2697031 RepID=UPI001376AF5B|nr:hypothetical protein [Corallococcus silvisoli]NBD11806.1 hypothetical protein [Corallococcus silvisoli]
MSFTAAKGTTLRMAEALVTFFRGEGATNYVEFKVHHPTDGDFILCIQRASGKTPHELRQDAESERDALRAQVAEVTNAAHKVVSDAKRPDAKGREWQDEHGERLVLVQSTLVGFLESALSALPAPERKEWSTAKPPHACPMGDVCPTCDEPEVSP